MLLYASKCMGHVMLFILPLALFNNHITKVPFQGTFFFTHNRNIYEYQFFRKF